jgi:superfamily II RNA helicase
MGISTAPLAALLAGRTQALAADEILSRFVGFVAASGLELYPAQEEALLELVAGKHIILNTPTGSGKSLVATAMHFKAMAEGKVSFYTCPIKALVSEKFFALCQLYGPENVGMMTGDATINREAPIICCTAEILANMALRDAAARVDYVIMDEFHYYSDRERGAAWQIPLLSMPDTTFLLMSATLGETRPIEQSLLSITRREPAVVRSTLRPVPLDFEYRETPLHETIGDLIATRRIPIYLVNFTQRACAEEAQNLMSVDISSKDEKEAIRRALHDFSFDTPYGKDFQRFIRHGIGLHHAGLLPKYRLLVEKLAQTGLLKVVSGTDTLGVGVNIPIRTVLFTQLCKFNGEKTGILSVRDFQQIAGRAGRKGFDERGTVVAQAPGHVIENRRLAGRQAGGKKVVMHKPPTKGYVHWDRGTFERLIAGTPEPLESRFAVTHGLLLNLLQSPSIARGGGYRRLTRLIAVSHGSERAKREARRHAAACFRSLRRAHIIDVIPGESARGRLVEVSTRLQRDFSLNQTLSMYLLEALGLLDETAETYALDVLSLVESILENPDVVLYRQLDKIKTERMDEMKAQGMEYEQRIAELETLEWPKPNREFIYATFNAFAQKHPWVGEENIRPKSVAREMFETFCTFGDYVRDYGLQRSEGVLLRYISEVYKTLSQTVPAPVRTDGVEDIIAHLRAMLREVDSSLVDEWESLKQGRAGIGVAAEAGAGEATRRVDLADDPKALAARIRVDLHRLMKALSARRYDEAVAALRAPAAAEGEMEGAAAGAAAGAADGSPWTAARFEEALAPYWAEHGSIAVTPFARRPSNTVIQPLGPRRWRAQQRLIDAEGDEDWTLDCIVDLSGDDRDHRDRDGAGQPGQPPRSETAPLIELQRIGI